MVSDRVEDDLAGGRCVAHGEDLGVVGEFDAADFGVSVLEVKGGDEGLGVDDHDCAVR